MRSRAARVENCPARLVKKPSPATKRPRCRQQLVHEAKAFGVDLSGEEIDTSRIAAPSREARHQAERRRIVGDAENDRDCCSYSFGRERGNGTGRRRDHGYAPLHKLCQQCRQAFVVAAQPVVLHRNILALNITAFVQPLAKGGEPRGFDGIRRPAVDESDHRRRRLLRPCCQRPKGRRRRAAEQRYELAPLHSITSSAVASSLSGTVRPSILAVEALMTSSNLVDCTTGKSAGFAPLRIRPA